MRSNFSFNPRCAYFSHVYPSSGSQRLFIVSKLGTCAFLCDDDTADDLEDVGSDPAVAEARYARISAILEARYTSNGLKGKAGVGLQELFNVWKEPLVDVPAQPQARFFRRFNDYTDAMKTLIGFRKAQRVPAVDTYIEMLLHRSWCFPAFNLWEGTYFFTPVV